MADKPEMTVTERSALIAHRLNQGAALTTEQVAELCGYVDRRGAYALMYRMSRVLPLVFCGGEWRLMDSD